MPDSRKMGHYISQSSVYLYISQDIMEEKLGLLTMRDELVDNIDGAIAAAIAHRESMAPYSNLWTEDRWVGAQLPLFGNVLD